MKKYIYTALIIFSLIIQSCVSDEKDIFPVSASQRLTDIQLKYANILTEASDGWILDFYPNVEKAGGTQFLISFSNDDMATVAMVSKSEAKTPPQTSMYHIKGDAGPVLSFDTYNKFIHLFSSPASDGRGFEGDYEFIILDATNDLITLKGKKSGIKMFMHRKKTPESWAEYIAKAADVETELTPRKMQLSIEGEDVRVINLQNILSFSLMSDNVETNYNMPYIITNKGIELFQPLIVKGKTITAFDWDEEQLKFVCTDKGVNAWLKAAVLLPNEFFAESTTAWMFDINVLNRRNASPDFLINYDACVQGSASRGETLNAIYFSYLLPTDMNMMGFVSGARAGGYRMFVVPTPDTPDRLTIQFSVTGDLIGSFYYKRVPGYKAFADYFVGQTFIMSEINITTLPMTIKFTDANNPKMWFQLVAVK